MRPKIAHWLEEIRTLPPAPPPQSPDERRALNRLQGEPEMFVPEEIDAICHWPIQIDLEGPPPFIRRREPPPPVGLGFDVALAAICVALTTLTVGYLIYVGAQ